MVMGSASPEKMMNDFKAYASRALNGQRESGETKRPGADACGSGSSKYWTEHGSTRWLWTTPQVEDKIRYVKDEQGAVMAYGEA